MSGKIKLAVIHSRRPEIPDDAHPLKEAFTLSGLRNYLRNNLEKYLLQLHEAGRSKADLVCTHEDFMGAGIYMMHIDRPHLFLSCAEEIPGFTFGKLCEIAKLYHMHIAANYYEKDGNDIYNTSVLIGREGQLIGKYRKVHLPPYEKWSLKAGSEFPVFETDIGRIGFSTCYDITFAEHCRIAALNGADIIIHATLGWGIGHDSKLGEALVRVRAAENSVYMLAAKNADGGSSKSCIVDNNGNVLAEGGGMEEKVVFAECKPDFDKENEAGFNSLFSGIKSERARFLLERRPMMYSAITHPTPPALDQYQGIDFSAAPEQVEEIYRKWRAYWYNIENNKPVTIRYHW